MTLQVFNINGEFPREKEKLNSSVSWDETSLINDLRILVGMLFGSIDFEGLWGNILFLTWIVSRNVKLGLYQKYLMEWH